MQNTSPFKSQGVPPEEGIHSFKYYKAHCHQYHWRPLLTSTRAMKSSQDTVKRKAPSCCDVAKSGRGEAVTLLIWRACYSFRQKQMQKLEVLWPPSFDVGATQSRNKCLLFPKVGITAACLKPVCISNGLLWHLVHYVGPSLNLRIRQIQSWSKVGKRLFKGIYTFSVDAVQNLSISGIAGRRSHREWNNSDPGSHVHWDLEFMKQVSVYYPIGLSQQPWENEKLMKEMHDVTGHDVPCLWSSSCGNGRGPWASCSPLYPLFTLWHYVWIIFIYLS